MLFSLHSSLRTPGRVLTSLVAAGHRTARLAASPRRPVLGLSKPATSCSPNSLENTPRPTGTLAGGLTLVWLSQPAMRPYCVPGPGLGAGALRERCTWTQLRAPGLMASSGEAV